MMLVIMLVLFHRGEMTSNWDLKKGLWGWLLCAEMLIHSLLVHIGKLHATMN